MTRSDRQSSIGIPAVVFVAVWAIHYLWHGFFPEQDPLQSQWAEVAIADAPWWNRYFAAQNHWLGFSYSLSLAFAAHAFQRYRRDRRCAGEKLAFGSVALAGFWATAGCFLIGCCGSPMMAVYLSLFGAAVLPFAKPVVAVLTTATVAAAWLYLTFRRQAGAVACGTDCEQPKRLGQTLL